ncbi:MAG: hypothetical protein Kow006_16140 [Gammaproteobacteria bacterium]
MARILIIDDDPDIIDSLTMILEGNNFEVASLTDTADLEASVRAIHPDLILLDIIFPDDPQAGFRAARRLAADEELKRIPVLVLSAVNERTNLGFSFTEQDISDDFLPVQGFLEKPVEPSLLIERINQLLGAG